MIKIIFIILMFLLGFCCGALFELRNTEKVNESWYLLAKKTNNDWAEYCKTLVDEMSRGEEE